MKRLLDLFAMTAGGWIGWVVGEPVSLFTAYVISVVGAGVGLYVVRRFLADLIP